MSAGMVYAAISAPGVELQFMLGERPDTDKVRDGTEMPQRMATDLLVAERLMAEAETGIKGYDFQVAADILHRLLDDAQARDFGSRRWRDELARKAAFAHGLY